jgi:4-hydroxy-3-methylbut-2-enyl diphosphate reductase
LSRISEKSNLLEQLQPLADLRLYNAKDFMHIIRAQHLGMCFGVRDAIASAITQAESQPLTILGELVHNPVVLDQLKRKGIRFASDSQDVKTATAMITAHGASQKAIDLAKKQGLHVLEATCPLVHFAHRTLADLVREGFYPVIIGQEKHVEVRGLTGDLTEYTVLLTEAEIPKIPSRRRIGVMVQTTQPLERARKLVEAIKSAQPNAEIRFVDTICHPTKQRQNAAIELARKVDAVIVVGGASSNNTRELAATCAKECAKVYHVQNATDLQAAWFDGCETVGITAGTSTLDKTIDEVEAGIHALTREMAMAVG